MAVCRYWTTRSGVTDEDEAGELAAHLCAAHVSRSADSDTASVCPLGPESRAAEPSTNISRWQHY